MNTYFSKKHIVILTAVATVLCVALTAVLLFFVPSSEPITLDTIPDYNGDAYVVLNDNVPLFTEDELSSISFEFYSPLDLLGRCGAATASIGRDIMPTEERESIGSVKPSGWQIAKYDFVDGKYLYNRCHLIGFQLTGENANEQNLITGTRYLNTEGMLPFENMVAEFVKDTDMHVMYRVTPIFKGANLIASGVQMEAVSVEDGGAGLSFHVYCYNVQPGVDIDYATGNNTLAEAAENDTEAYILNTNSKRIHKPTCEAASTISEHNRKHYTGDISKLLNDGYSRCGSCFANE